jgi:hypothetical protein
MGGRKLAQERGHLRRGPAVARAGRPEVRRGPAFVGVETTGAANGLARRDGAWCVIR